MANNENIILLQSPAPKLEENQKSVFNSTAQDFLVKLHRQFESKIEQLYKNRSRRSVELQTQGTLEFKKSPQREDKDWKIASLPSRLQYVPFSHTSTYTCCHFLASYNFQKIIVTTCITFICKIMYMLLLICFE